MKTLCFILFACLTLVSLASCEKQQEITPELIEKVVGEYPFSYVVAKGQTYDINQTNITGKARIERKSSTSVKLVWSYKGAGSSYSGSYTGVSLTDPGTGEIELRSGGNVIATVSDETLHLNVENSNSERLTFIGYR